MIHMEILQGTLSMMILQTLAAGRKQVTEEHSRWRMFVRAVTRVMRPAI